MNNVQVSAILAALLLAPFQAGQWGMFKGTVKSEWLPDGRHMKLLDKFEYMDPGNRWWDAPAGTVVDGASIPRVFWSFIGGPFEGKYRNASVTHDVACVRKDRPWQDVHMMFYTASRLGGVRGVPAKVMYFGIYHWGPRWPPPKAPSAWTLGRTLTTDDDFLRGRAYIIRNPQVDLKQIEELTSSFLAQAIPEVPPGILFSPEDASRW